MLRLEPRFVSLDTISSVPNFLKPLAFHSADFCTFRLPAPEEFPVSPPKPSAALRALPNIWHLTGMFPHFPLSAGCWRGGSWIMPWFPPATQSVNKQEQGKHMCRWMVNLLCPSLSGYQPGWYQQENQAALLDRRLICGSLLGGGSRSLRHTPCPVSIPHTPYLNPPGIQNCYESHNTPCSVICHIFLSAMCLAGNFLFWLWAFKKALCKRNFLCEVSLIPPNVRVPLLVLILPFQSLYTLQHLFYWIISIYPT